MLYPRRFTIYLVILLGLISACIECFAQSKDLDPEKWAVELNKKGYIKSKTPLKLDSLLKTDSLQTINFLDKLEQQGKSKGVYFHAHFYSLKARVIYRLFGYANGIKKHTPAETEKVRRELIQLYNSAIHAAYQSEDDYLIAYVSYLYASVIGIFGEVGLSVMYGKNAVDLYEKLSQPISASTYQFLAEILYKVREYDECIRYARKAVSAWQIDPREFKAFTVSCINTLALGYHRQNIYDSALIYYNQALILAKQINNPVWTGIVSGNIAQILYMQGKYDSAYALLKIDYQTSKESALFDNAANSLQWAARANLAKGNKGEALTEVREAFQLLKLWPDANYLRNTYYTTTQIFREMGAYDSAFHYNNLYSALNDSLEKVVATSSLSISRARLNDETSRYNIQNLKNEQRSQVLYRNAIIAAIVALSLLALLFVNRQRLKEKIKTEKAEQEKLRMEQEIASAKDQMKMFTENIIEKTNLIEKLESQIQGKAATSEQQTIILELSRQTILTEEDWNKFKSLFEKIYPGFFINLVKKFPDITLAEQRMAALTRLHLTTRQIASMLGISVDSVHKSRQRLRQRFQVGTETNLDELVSKL